MPDWTPQFKFNEPKRVLAVAGVVVDDIARELETRSRRMFEATFRVVIECKHTHAYHRPSTISSGVCLCYRKLTVASYRWLLC